MRMRSSSGFRAVALHVTANAALVVFEAPRQSVERIANRDMCVHIALSLMRLDYDFAAGNRRLDPHGEQVATLSMSVRHLDHDVAVGHALGEALELLCPLADLSFQCRRTLNVAKRDSKRFHGRRCARVVPKNGCFWHGRCFLVCMANDDLQAAYRRFAAMYANSHLVRNVDDFEAAVRAAGIGLPDVSDSWLRSLDRRWVYGETAAPFPDEDANRRYRRLVEV